MDHEALQLRVIILIKEIRALVNEKHGLDQMRLGRVDLEGKNTKDPGKQGRVRKHSTKITPKPGYQKQRRSVPASWP